MDYLSSILPHEGLAYVGVFWLAMGLGLVAGALIGKLARRASVMKTLGVRALLTVVGIGATAALAVPAFIALNAVAVLPAAALLSFTIAIVVWLGNPANQWDPDQEKWVVSLGEKAKS